MTALLSPKAIAHGIYAAVIDQLQFGEGEEIIQISIGNGNGGKVRILRTQQDNACRVNITVSGSLIQSPSGYTRSESWRGLAKLLRDEGLEVISSDSLGGAGIEVVVLISAS